MRFVPVRCRALRVLPRRDEKLDLSAEHSLAPDPTGWLCVVRRPLFLSALSSGLDFEEMATAAYQKYITNPKVSSLQTAFSLKSNHKNVHVCCGQCTCMVTACVGGDGGGHVPRSVRWYCKCSCAFADAAASRRACVFVAGQRDFVFMDIKVGDTDAGKAVIEVGCLRCGSICGPALP